MPDTLASYNQMRDFSLAAALRGVSEPLVPQNYDFHIENNFRGITRAGFDLENPQHNNGWKFHISVDPNDLGSAWDKVIVPAVLKANAGGVKFAADGAFERMSQPENPQAGKFITIYGIEPAQMPDLVQEIESGLVREGIRQGPTIQGDKPVEGSRYIAYRNDRALGGGDYLDRASVDQLVSTGQLQEADRYNPSRSPDPLDGFDVAAHSLKPPVAPSPSPDFKVHRIWDDKGSLRLTLETSVPISLEQRSAFIDGMADRYGANADDLRQTPGLIQTEFPKTPEGRANLQRFLADAAENRTFHVPEEIQQAWGKTPAVHASPSANVDPAPTHLPSTPSSDVSPAPTAHAATPSTPPSAHASSAGDVRAMLANQPFPSDHAPTRGNLALNPEPAPTRPALPVHDEHAVVGRAKTAANDPAHPSVPHEGATPHALKGGKGVKGAGLLGAPLSASVAGVSALLAGETVRRSAEIALGAGVESTPAGIAMAAAEGRSLEATYRGYEQIPVLGTIATEISRPIARALGYDVDAGAVESAVVAANNIATEGRGHAQQQAAAYGKALAAHLPELQAKGWGGALGNKDGKLEAHEVVKALREHGVTSLAQLDKDGNGVTGKEITDVLLQPLPVSGKAGKAR